MGSPKAKQWVIRNDISAKCLACGAKSTFKDMSWKGFLLWAWWKGFKQKHNKCRYTE